MNSARPRVQGGTVRHKAARLLAWRDHRGAALRALSVDPGTAYLHREEERGRAGSGILLACSQPALRPVTAARAPCAAAGSVSPAYRKPDTRRQHRAVLTEDMTSSEPARTAAWRARSLTPASLPGAPATGITIYGCERDEAVLFRRLAPGLGVLPAITEAAVSEANIGLAEPNRCVSIGHKAGSRTPPFSRSAVSACGISPRGASGITISMRSTRKASVLPSVMSPIHPAVWLTTPSGLLERTRETPIPGDVVRACERGRRHGDFIFRAWRRPYLLKED